MFRLLALALLFGAATEARVQLEDPWVRLLPPSSDVTAAFLTIRNDTAEADTLLSAAGDCAAAVELHVMKESDGKMTMQKVDRLVIPARGKLELLPGGTHIMLIGLTRPLSVEEPIKLTLRFSREGDVPLIAPVVDLRRKARGN